MKRICLFLCTICLAAGQFGPPPELHRPPPDGDVKLPNGKSQRDEILKEDYKKNLEDAAELMKLATDLKAELEKDEQFAVSVKTLKTVDDIEKRTKSIRGRLKRF